MAIDVGREMESICREVSFDKLDELLSRIFAGGSPAEFRRFCDRLAAVWNFCERKAKSGRLQDMLDPLGDLPYLISDANYETLLSPEWMARLEMRHLGWPCEILRRRYGARRKTFLDRVLADGRIAAEKRAALCGAIFDCEAYAVRTSRGFLSLPPIWHYNRCLCGRVIDVRRSAEHPLIRKIDIPRRGGGPGSAAMESGAARDSFAVFEVNREIEARPIDNALVEHLIRHDAARCFTGLLRHHPKEMFELRSPEEWLLTVCRAAREKLAVAAVSELEREFPGLVARTRDQWGNTPLWNTFVNPNPTGKLRKELIRFGCDPDAQNEWGLTYRLVKDNTPEKMWKKRAGKA